MGRKLSENEFLLVPKQHWICVPFKHPHPFNSTEISAQLRLKKILYLAIINKICLYPRYNEVYTWNNVNTCVHNIIVGQLWIEQVLFTFLEINITVVGTLQ